MDTTSNLSAWRADDAERDILSLTRALTEGGGPVPAAALRSRGALMFLALWEVLRRDCLANGSVCVNHFAKKRARFVAMAALEPSLRYFRERLRQDPEAAARLFERRGPKGRKPRENAESLAELEAFVKDDCGGDTRVYKNDRKLHFLLFVIKRIKNDLFRADGVDAEALKYASRAMIQIIWNTTAPSGREPRHAGEPFPFSEGK